LGKPNATTREGALLTISKIDDLTKWMATLEIAILGGLAYLILGTDSPLLNRMNSIQKVFAMVVGMNLGIAILICGWLFTSLGSVATRIFGVVYDGNPTTKLDVATWPIYGHRNDRGLIKLNYLVALKHWFWGLGLGSVALLVVSLLICPPPAPDKKTLNYPAATPSESTTTRVPAVGDTNH
jgi:hypothetical protein